MYFVATFTMLAPPTNGARLYGPTAIRVTEIFYHFYKEHRHKPAQCQSIDERTVRTRQIEGFIKLDADRYACIIVSASGMASGESLNGSNRTLD
jgi:hypothetical protein